MSNRRRLSRADARKIAHEQRRFVADRYKPHNRYSARELRTILVEDAIARRVTPLQWMMLAIKAIATSERATEEQVFQQLRSECFEACGLDMPFGG